MHPFFLSRYRVPGGRRLVAGFFCVCLEGCGGFYTMVSDSVSRAHTSIYKGWLPSNINVSRIRMVLVQHKRNNYLRDGSRSPDVDVQA